MLSNFGETGWGKQGWSIIIGWLLSVRSLLLMDPSRHSGRVSFKLIFFIDILFSLRIDRWLLGATTITAASNSTCYITYVPFCFVYDSILTSNISSGIPRCPLSMINGQRTFFKKVFGKSFNQVGILIPPFVFLFVNKKAQMISVLLWAKSSLKLPRIMS